MKTLIRYGVWRPAITMAEVEEVRELARENAFRARIHTHLNQTEIDRVDRLLDATLTDRH